MNNLAIERNSYGNKVNSYAQELDVLLREENASKMDEILNETFKTPGIADIVDGSSGTERTEWDAIHSFLADVDATMDFDDKEKDLSPSYSFSPEELMQNDSFGQFFDPDELMSPVSLNSTYVSNELSNVPKQSNNNTSHGNKPIKQASPPSSSPEMEMRNPHVFNEYKKFVPIKPKVERQGIACQSQNQKPVPSPPKETISSVKFVNKTEDDRNLEAQQKILKKQQRIVRNRESALHSRKRKKELMQTLEITVNTLSSLNSQLKVENDYLKETIKKLETENWTLKNRKLVNVPELAKKTSYVLVVFVFLALNLKQSSLPSPSSSSSRSLNPVDLYKMPSRHGRLLLEYNKIKTSERNLMHQNSVYDEQKQSFHPKAGIAGLTSNEIKKRIMKEQRRYLKQKRNDEMRNNVTNHTDPSCVNNFNETELFRLNEALETLVKTPEKKETKHESEKLIKQKKRRPSVKKNHLNEVSNCSTTNNNQTANCTKRNIKTGSSKLRMKKKLIKSNEIQIFQPDLRALNKLQKAIDRQPNTFYVMSFRKDHIIFPATEVNSTQRPKLSFIFPVSNQSIRNETVDSIAMVQIDCQVMDTKTLNISKNSLIHLFDFNRH